MSKAKHRQLLSVVREVLILVVGILLAFWLNARWDKVQNRNREIELLHALEIEFEEAAIYLEEAYQIISLNRSRSSMILDILQDHPEDSRVMVHDSIALFLMGSVTLDVPMITLQSAMASGAIELVSSGRLKSYLTMWPRDVAEVQEELLISRRLVYESLIQGFPGDFSELVRTATPIDGQVTNSQRYLPNSGQVRNTLAARERLADITSKELDELFDQLDLIRTLLAESLN